MVENLRERWIRAMIKIPFSLIGYRGFTEQDAFFLYECFQKDAPERPNLKKVLALECETSHLPKATFPECISTKQNCQSILEVATIPTPVILNKSKPKHKVVQPNINDYPEPWCKVIKDNKIIRYEDAQGKPIPEMLWQTVNK